MIPKRVITGACALTISLFFTVQAWSMTLSFEQVLTNVNVLEDFEIDLVLSDMTDFDTISVFDMIVNFDPTAISFNSYTLGRALGDIAIFEAYDFSSYLTPGKLNLYEASSIAPDLISGGTFFGDQFTSTSDRLPLATVSFTANTPGVTTLSVSDVMLGDEWGTTISSTTNLGLVNTTAPIPEPATVILFGTGIAGLIGTRLRKRNNTQTFSK